MTNVVKNLKVRYVARVIAQSLIAKFPEKSTYITNTPISELQQNVFEHKSLVNQRNIIDLCICPVSILPVM